MSRIARYAPLSAVLMTLLFAAAFVILGDTPSTGDSAHKVVTFYKDNKTETFVSSTLVALGSVAVVWFAASLRAHITLREGPPGRIASLPLAAGILIAVGATTFAGIEFGLADSADDIPASAMQALNALDNSMFFVFLTGFVLMYASLAVAILRHGVFPKWLGWVALILAIVSITPAGFFVFLLSGLLFPVFGFLIYREGDASGRPAAPRQA